MRKRHVCEASGVIIKEQEQTYLSKRDVGIDLTRLIALVFVIMIHTSGQPWEGNRLTYCIGYTTLFSCNPVFLMISGKYNLRHRFEDIYDYKKYYFKKASDILFPYLTVSMLLTIWRMIVQDETINAVSFIKNVFGEIASGNNNTHLWFMYLLMGFLLSAPFWAKMLQSMNDRELKLFLTITILWNIIVI